MENPWFHFGIFRMINMINYWRTPPGEKKTLTTTCLCSKRHLKFQSFSCWSRKWSENCKSMPKKDKEKAMVPFRAHRELYPGLGRTPFLDPDDSLNSWSFSATNRSKSIMIELCLIFLGGKRFWWITQYQNRWVFPSFNILPAVGLRWLRSRTCPRAPRHSKVRRHRLRSFGTEVWCWMMLVNG